MTDRPKMAAKTAAAKLAAKTMAAAKVIAAVTLAAAVVAAANAARAQSERRPALPYTTIDHPQFVPAAQAAFLHPGDLLIGVSAGGVAKAYPAAILAQHGVVQDRMPDGPIAVTW